MSQARVPSRLIRFSCGCREDGDGVLCSHWPLIQLVISSALEQSDPRAEILHLEMSREEFKRDIISITQTIHINKVLVKVRNIKDII